MSIELLLKELLDNNVKLSVKGDKLLCQLPEAGINDKLFESLKEQKEELKKAILQKINFRKYQPIPKAAAMDSYPLTSSQKRLWVLSQFEGGSQAYNMSFVTKLTGELNVAYFEKAFKELIERHEILRTLFKSDDETQDVRQIIVGLNEIDFTIEQPDFSGQVNCHQEVENYLELKNKEAFDLENGPLLRVSLIKTAENEYVFLLSMHHIISDGWSMELMVSEIVQRYNNLLAEKENAIQALAIQYKDYATWLEAEKQNAKYQESEKYWIEKFTGDLIPLTLPSSRPRPAIQTFNGNDLSHTFSEAFTTKMKLFSEEKGVTMFTTLMTVIKALLYRYSGQNDIIVGTPIAGREHPDLENQIGMYVNTLAIRTQFEEKNTFAELLQIEKDNLIAANEHQMYSLDELVSKLNVKRDLRRSVLFDVMVVYQNQSLLNLGSKKEDADNLCFEKFDLHKKSSQFDISFNFSETDNQLGLNIEYNTDIYDAFLIERIFSHFVNFSEKALTQPEIFIEEVDYLTEAEKNQLLFDFNDTTVGYPKDKTIVDLFEEQVDKTPNNIAVVFEDIELTYKELNEQANRLAYYLRENYDIKPDDLIGIKLERSEKMVVSILGILKSGAAYVPIDPVNPQDRIDYIEKDSNSKLVIDDNELDLFYVDQEKYSVSNPEGVNSPDDLIYVIYTSGTTGNPKGTLLEHKNVVRLFFTDKPLFDFNEKDVWTMFHSYAFDFSVWEMYGALLFGGKLVVVPKLIAKNTPEFLGLLQDQSVTVLNQTPSSFYNLINNEIEDEKKCHTLRYVIFGGEALNPVLLQDWHQKYPDAKLINMYGITETTVHVTYKEINEKEICSEQSNIGKPIPTLNCYILDANKNLAPIGVTGELYVAGLGLARGYLNLPELTSKKFIPNPFVEGERLYDSGDLACWLPDGNLEYLGRKDQQVKIRGYRIELGDIENAILQYSDEVKHVVVDVKEINHEKLLVAYLVSNSTIEKSELRSFLLGKIPEYMIPSYFVYLEELPLTSNGKVNRKALPAVTGDDAVLKTYVAPVNDLEEQILAIINEMTPVNQGRVGVTDNFFEIGLNSLSIVKVTNIIKKDLGIEVKLLDLFQFPNVKMLVENLQDKKEEKSETFHENVSEDMDSMVDLF
ncbi:amino acid adenylation domain-containing protein [Flavobacterium amniphilum]|uniref:non-ribosomal peptide synthetase n=1 Tax=Flavobacterium amniphilum TaxID=1834035 RepID=UPI002029BB3D|nr:amino acid adenylation domain-containing protein [Flavobacterium amniphilum]MCL9807486.1 amino acid adenylation domain-containing protein [Flavobacterium amniphilum]